VAGHAGRPRAAGAAAEGPPGTAVGPPGAPRQLRAARAAGATSGTSSRGHERHERHERQATSGRVSRATRGRVSRATRGGVHAPLRLTQLTQGQQGTATTVSSTRLLPLACRRSARRVSLSGAWTPLLCRRRCPAAASSGPNRCNRLGVAACCRARVAACSRAPCRRVSLSGAWIPPRQRQRLTLPARAYQHRDPVFVSRNDTTVDHHLTQMALLGIRHLGCVVSLL